jgi:hypothetical protein
MACTFVLQAEAQPERVAWARTTVAFAGRHVVVRLTTGTRIDGHWVGVTPETFTMSVTKTSDRRVVSAGLQTLPRSSIVTLRAGKQRVRGRVIGTVAGFYGPATLGYLVTRQPDGLQSGWGIAAYTLAFVGFFVGRAYDHGTREVVLLP